MDNEGFHTFNEYMKKDGEGLTPSMEDYMEMLYRLCKDNGFTRINDLAEALNVKPPSVTKMIQRLSKINLIKYEKYGVIELTEEGKEVGEFLLRRHNIIRDFLRLIGITEAIVLEETEKVEHTLSNETVKCFERYLNFMSDNPIIKDTFMKYIKNNK